MKMKRSHRRLLCAVLCATLGVPPASVTRAEDIDLFVSAAATAATNPNILIVLDNSANWNSNAQHWPTPSGESGAFKQGESELRAIQTVLNELDGNNPKVNLGLMVHRSGAPDGGIVRYAIRPMNNTNKNAFVELIGPRTGCSSTNSLNGTPNCMLQNFSGTGQEQTNNSNYGGALFDAYKYFGGWTAPAYANLDNASQVTTPVDSTHFGKPRHFDAGGAPAAYMDRDAYTADFKDYVSPVNSACAKNYVIFIGNGFPGQENTSTDAAVMLQNVNLGVTPQLPAQLSQPDFTTITSQVTDSLGTYAPCSTRATCASAAAAAAPGQYDTYSCTGGTQNDFTTLGTSSVCQTNATCVATATASFPGFTTYQCTGGSSTQSVVNPACMGTGQAACDLQGALLLPGYATYSCSGGTTVGCASGRRGRTITGTCAAGTITNQTMQGINGAVCAGSNFLNQTMQGTKTVSTLTPLPTFSAPGKPNYADEWAKFLYTTDVTDLPGQQNVTTFTIDVYKDLPSADETALLFNMAKFGGGKYFQASNEQAIVNALRQIMIEIQSVNSVFASASLPINATNRSQNENQVFIGMFRPDSAARPRWYGNLKRYQIGQFGQEFKLADASTPPLEAVSSTTGFVQPCAKSFWTVDSGDYWLFQNGSAGQCTTSGTNIFSDSPDGPQVEKGAVAEVLRRGNNPPTAAGPLTASPNRTIFTCMDATTCCTAPATCGGSPATQLVTFDRTNVSKAQLGDASMSDLERDNIINFTIGQDLFDDNTNSQATEVRPSVHGDVAHSRPLPVNYGGATGVVLYYGAGDGSFRSVRGSDGKELWAFIAPEHHAKLKRLTDNSPPILYPNQLASLKIPDGDGSLFSIGDTVTGDTSGAKAEVSNVVTSDDPDTLVITNISGSFEFGEILSVGGVPQTKIVEVPVAPTKKDYFFDGSAGLFQNKDNSLIWVFPSMRRGGRMVYGFNVTNPATPQMMWRVGCGNSDLNDTASCTKGFEQMGQTWSLPSVALIKGYSTDLNTPVVIVGGGYDTCDDQDEAPNTQCTSPKGNRVFVIDAGTGALIRSFATAGSVVGDVTLLDRDFDGFVDQAYAADTKGGIYRIDFVNPTNPGTTRTKDEWTMTEIARTTGANRKFLFAPAALGGSGKVYLALASGDRERPLISNYPFDPVKGGPVTNRAYQVIDKFERTTDPATGTVTGPAVLNLDDTSLMQDFTAGTTCTTASPEANNKRGWFFDLNAGTGEQGVTSSTIFGGLVFFSTNRPLPTPPGACANNLGEARGYAVNLLNASGAVGTDLLCGAQRSGIFVGGGLPPSPVTGTVPVGGKPVTIMIGGIERSTGIGSPIEGQQVKPNVTQRRTRIYWYSHGDK
jgi:Tfp pilus tip-associated adhesin PilY1